MTKPISFEEIVGKYREFLAERGWGREEPREFAISISLEANELLEHYQWDSKPVGTPDELADELADIVMYAIQFADCYDIDIPTAIENKLKKAGEKYPSHEFAGKDQATKRAAWLSAKKRHIKKESL